MKIYKENLIQSFSLILGTFHGRLEGKITTSASATRLVRNWVSKILKNMFNLDEILCDVFFQF